MPVTCPREGRRLIAGYKAMSETISLTAVKDRFSEIVDRVYKQHDRVIVTRNGVPASYGACEGAHVSESDRY
jgi:prevent-host-death family protein